jgi:thiol-disulfide isomerase/thioredoxin
VALAIGLVVVGLLGVFNLLLAYGLIRRMREHSDLISRLSDAVSGRSSAGSIAAPGTRVPPFQAVTVDSEVVDSRRLGAATLVGFFSPGCAPCEELLPQFLATARETPGGRQAVLAVVVSDDSSGAYLVEPLRDVASVVVEGRGGELGTAFGVSSYPATCEIDATGTVTSTRLAVAAGV